MNGKLVIKNFGPIKSVELELSRFIILIGDQGTGKSTVAKLIIAIDNTCYRELLDLPENSAINRETQLFLEYLKIVGIEGHIKHDTEIFYKKDEYTFRYQSAVARITDLKIGFDQTMAYNFNYIPAERILVSTLTNSLYSLMLNDVSLPKLFLRFGDKFQKGRLEEKIFDFKEILKVDYKYSADKDIVVLPSGKEIYINEASSGIQGSIPLLVVFDYISNTVNNGNLLVIEEPELSCFPETQNKLIRHFVKSNKYVNKMNEYKNQLLITTHSPYILTSLNNLMYAHAVGKNYKMEVKDIISEEYWLSATEVSAYMMLPDGRCESIIDKEGLIKAEKIDGVSSVLNKDFNAIMDIEVNSKK